MSKFHNILRGIRDRSNDLTPQKQRLMHPGRDWLIGVLIFAIVVGCGGVWSGIFFLRYSSVDLIEGESNVILPRYNERQVTEALEQYRERTEEYDRLRSVTISLPTNVATSSSNGMSTLSEEDGATSTPAEEVTPVTQ